VPNYTTIGDNKSYYRISSVRGNNLVPASTAYQVAVQGTSPSYYIIGSAIIHDHKIRMTQL